jgi:hypothetical protein
MALDHKVVEKITRPDDPRRCQAVVPSGQCDNVAVEGGKNCYAHGGYSTVKKQERESIYRFRVQKYQQRVGEIAKSSNIKCLREEIGVLRMILEEKLNACQNDAELLLNSGDLSDLVVKIDKLVNSCHGLESKLGVMIDKSTLLSLVDQMVAIIGKEIEDPELVDKIAVQLLTVMEQTEINATNLKPVDKPS